MSDTLPDRIEVTFSMTADDYARYFAIVRHEEADRASYIPLIAAAGCSIVVALIFREIASHQLPNRDAWNAVGYGSLFAFLLGIWFVVVVVYLGRRAALRRYLGETLNAYEPKTAVLDASGFGLTGQLSQSTWRWAAVSRFTSKDGLFLIWIGQTTAVVIPSGSFGDGGASVAAFVRARLSEAAGSADVAVK